MYRSFSRRAFLSFAAAGAAGAALAACGPGAPVSPGASPGAATSTSGTAIPGAPTGQKVTLESWDWWVTQGPTVDQEIALFQQANPAITIHKTTQVTDKYPDLLQLAMKGQTGPDVFLIPEKPTLQEQIGQNWLLPLDRWATPTWRAAYPPNSFAEGSNVFNGHLFSAPFDGHSAWLQLYLNDDAFRKAGLVHADGSTAAPKSWDDVRDAAKKITSSGGQVHGWGFGNKQKFVLAWQMMMCQTSGSPDAATGFDLRTGRYTWATNPVFLDWITFFMGMKSDSSIVPNAMSMDDETARVAFAQGNFGMLIGGVWVQSGWQKTNPEFQNYSLVSLPHRGADPASYFYWTPGGIGFAISAQTKYPDAAWLWFDWLNSKAAAIRWVKAGQGLRIYPDANKPDFAPTSQFRQFMEIAAQGVRLAPAPTQEHPAMSDVKVQPTLPDIEAILEGIYVGQIADWKGALLNLQQRQNDALDAAIKDAQKRGINVDPAWWRVADWDITKDYQAGVTAASTAGPTPAGSPAPTTPPKTAVPGSPVPVGTPVGGSHGTPTG